MKPHTLHIDIDLSNAAFGDWPSHEIVRILQQLAERLDSGRYDMFDLEGTGVPMIDINGNTVGRARIAKEA